MSLREELDQFYQNLKKDLNELYEKAKPHPLIGLSLIIAIGLLVAIPYVQVHELNNTTERAKQENKDRATLAQIFGGVAIGIGLYYTWRRITILQETSESNRINAEKSLKVSQEGQITERFTRAVDQLGAIDKLGNPAIEIRLGGIYALERIANESERDYWLIMEILTVYIRKNSNADSRSNKKSTAIKAKPIKISTNKGINEEYSKAKKMPTNTELNQLIGIKR
jgi:hypothetical protein